MGLGRSAVKNIVGLFAFLPPVRKFFIVRKYHQAGMGTIMINFIVQRIFRINGATPWVVHFTSRVIYPRNISIRESDKSYNVYNSFASSPNCYFQAYNSIEIGENFLFGPGLHVISSNHDPAIELEPQKGKPVIIGRNVWIGANVVILPECTIGDNVVIGAGSVVTKSIPPNVLAAGNPARIIREITAAHA